MLCLLAEPHGIGADLHSTIARPVGLLSDPGSRLARGNDPGLALDNGYMVDAAVAASAVVPEDQVSLLAVRERDALAALGVFILGLRVVREADSLAFLDGVRSQS